MWHVRPHNSHTQYTSGVMSVLVNLASYLSSSCWFAFHSQNVFVVSRCWMNGTPKALLAHYFTNMTTLVVLVCSGIVMLVLVYRQIRTRDEWKQNRVAFFSIWGLSCLFGTTWGLTFLDYGPLSDFILFLSCILNSFQGQCLAYTVSVQHSYTVDLIPLQMLYTEFRLC